MSGARHPSKFNTRRDIPLQQEDVAYYRLKLTRFRGHADTRGRAYNMPKSRPPYPPGLRRRMVEMVRSGRRSDSLAEKYETSAQAMRNWVRQIDRHGGKRSDGLSSAEKEEFARPRRENRALREERSSLAKASAWFARGTGKIPSGTSSPASAWALEVLGQRHGTGVIHHSDQGSRYTSIALGNRCEEAGVRPWMGSLGDAYDNAMAEIVFATLEWARDCFCAHGTRGT